MFTIHNGLYNSIRKESNYLPLDDYKLTVIFRFAKIGVCISKGGIKMKVIIIGGVAGGATTAARLRRLDEKAEIILIERGNFISFANCGLPYFIGDVIKNKKDLLVQTPENFNRRFNIDVRIKHEVIGINRQEKYVQIKNLETNEEYNETYDKLVLSPGAKPINPFKNIESERIKTLRNVEDSISIKETILNKNLKNISIIGGGYIGVEVAENLSNYKDIKVTMIEKSSHLIAPLDKDMARFVHNVLRENGINLILNNGVKEINNNNNELNITLENDENVETDFIILCIGVRPEDDLARQAGLDIYPNGGIVVNEQMKTNDNDIYALGDAVKIKNCVTEEFANISLAGPANKQARIVANNICGIKSKYDGSIGSSILKLFNYNVGMTGINEAIAKMKNIQYKTIILSPFSHATYYPGANMLTIKAIYEEKTGRILGAQIFGKEGVDKITDILATAIIMKMTAYDLEKLDLCYAPPFSSAKSPVNLLGNSIVNVIEGLVETVTWEDVKERNEDVKVLDVRTDREYEAGAYKDCIHIPLDDLRNRLNELDMTKTYLVYCRTGLRSYIACRILSQNGFKVKNITGGYYYYEQ